MKRRSFLTLFGAAALAPVVPDFMAHNAKADLIVDGSISVSRLSAISANLGPITADKIVAGSITANKIYCSAVTVNHLSIGALPAMGSYLEVEPRMMVLTDFAS